MNARAFGEAAAWDADITREEQWWLQRTLLTYSRIHICILNVIVIQARKVSVSSIFARAAATGACWTLHVADRGVDRGDAACKCGQKCAGARAKPHSSELSICAACTGTNIACASQGGSKGGTHDEHSQGVTQPSWHVTWMQAAVEHIHRPRRFVLSCVVHHHYQHLTSDAPAAV